MNDIVKIIAIIATSCLLASCNHKKTNESYDEFYFSIAGEVDSYNSKTNIYTRSYVSSNSSVQIELSPQEISEIKKLFEVHNFISFPDQFECSENGTFTLPAFNTTIEIEHSQGSKKVTQTDYCDRKIQQKKSDKFDDLSSKIWGILKAKEQVKNMKPTDMIFL